MNKTKLIGSMLVAVLAFGSSTTTSNATAGAVLESGKCVLTLPDKVLKFNDEFNTYVTGYRDSNIPFRTTFLTRDMLVCPEGVEPSWPNDTFNGNDNYSNQPHAFVSSSNPISEAEFVWEDLNVFNPATQQTTRKSGWTVRGDSGTYDSIIPRSEYGAKPYLVIDGLNYELKLAKPFELINGDTQSPNACVMTLPNLSNHFSDPNGELNTFHLSGSNIKCPAETDGHQLNLYTESDYESSVSFLDAQGKELPLNFCRALTPNVEVGITRFATSLCLNTYSGNTGVFVKAKNGSVIADAQTGIRYPVVLAAPFKVKRATDVTAKVKRKGSYLTINIQADRNYAVDNNRGSTNRRQTVIVNDKADRAVIKRGNKVIATVKLSMYGNGKVKVKDTAGKNNYTVTLIETDGNYAGVASFKK